MNPESDSQDAPPPTAGRAAGPVSRYHAAFGSEHEREWLEGIIATVADAVVCSDENGRIELYNPAAQRIFGWTPEEVIGRDVRVLMPDHHASRHGDYMRRYLDGGAPRVIGLGRETLGQRRDGEVFPMWLAMTDGKAGSRRIFTAVIRDITEQRRTQDELERYRRTLEEQVVQRTAELESANRRLEALSLEDPLTGIANRRRFDSAFDVELRRAWRSGSGSTLSLLMCDIDHFKSFNDTYGHSAGDQCLVRVARIVADKGRRAADLVARIGGEEFAVLMPDTRVEVAAVVAEDMRRAVWDAAIEHRGAPAGRVTLSIGAAGLAPGELQASAVQLLARADRALYRAKDSGRNAVVFDGQCAPPTSGTTRDPP